MRKISILIFLLVNFSCIFASSVHAQNLIGVSPGDVRFTDVLRGGYAQRPILISLDTEEKIDMQVEAWGDIKDWFNFSEKEYPVSRSTSWRLMLSVNPPRDVPNGNYTGFVRVKSDPLGRGGSSGNAVGAVQAVIDVVVYVEVSDKEIRSCRASNFRVNSVEKGDDLVFTVDILNQGNIRLRPELSTKIWDSEQVNIVKTAGFVSGEILPTTTKEVSFRVGTNDLDVNQYWVDFLAEDCLDSELLTFDVLEEGALRADGVITGIISKTWANVGETVPIEVSFKNIGQKEVDAQFRGKIMLGDKVVNVLDSEVESVLMADSTNFTFFYTPTEVGKYVVSGRVFYDKKRTFESGTIINVRPKSFTLNTLLIYLLYIVIFIALMFFFYKIRSERIRYSNMLRRLRSV